MYRAAPTKKRYWRESLILDWTPWEAMPSISDTSSRTPSMISQCWCRPRWRSLRHLATAAASTMTATTSVTPTRIPPSLTDGTL